jgi:hypothetical protein
VNHPPARPLAAVTRISFTKQPVNYDFLDKPALFWTNSATSGASICALMSTRRNKKGTPSGGVPRSAFFGRAKPRAALTARGVFHRFSPQPLARCARRDDLWAIHCNARSRHAGVLKGEEMTCKQGTLSKCRPKQARLRAIKFCWRQSSAGCDSGPSWSNTLLRLLRGHNGAGRPVSSWRWRLGPARFGSYRKPMGVWGVLPYLPPE